MTSMVKNFLILAHHSPHQLNRLVQRLYDDHSFFYIHIDLKSDIESFKSLITLPKVYFIEDRVNAIWGNFTIIQATLNALAQIIRDNRPGFTILLSGQDYPLATNKELTEYFLKNKTYNFIDIKPIEEAWPEEYLSKTTHFYINLTPKRGNGLFIPYFKNVPFVALLKIYLRLIKSSIVHRNITLFFLIFNSLKKRKSPVPFQYGGSQWWALNLESLKMIMGYIHKYPNYINYHKFTYIPDEIFFHTIIKILQEQHKNILTKPSIMYVNWHRLEYDFPAVFGIKDTMELINAKQNEKLFARKFDEAADDKILDFLDHQVN